MRNDPLPDFALASTTNCNYNYSHERQLASASEQLLVQQLHALLGTAVTTGRHSRWPEVVGEIALLRYIRAAQGNVHHAAQTFTNHLITRKDFGMDDMRDKAYLKMKDNGFTFVQDDLIWGAQIGVSGWCFFFLWAGGGEKQSHILQRTTRRTTEK